MTEKEKEAIALFRYGIIAPLVTQSEVSSKERNKFFIDASRLKYKYIDGEYKTVSYFTVYRYYKAYIEKGFDGLRPKGRSDLGIHRKLDPELMDRIEFIHSEYPRLPCTLILDKLITSGAIKKDDVSLSTITRFIARLKKEKELPKKEYRRYEREHINEVWYGDTSRGPYIKLQGKKYKTHIIAFIDDASRFIVGVDIFLNDNFINLMSVLKSAVSRYGRPKILKFDNGSNYRSSQMELLSARLGSALSYAPPYTPESKAKIERWFRTLKDHFIADLDMKEYTDDLDKLRCDLRSYAQSYNQTVHSSLKMTPQDRFFNEASLIIRLDSQRIDEIFLLELERRVSKDGVIVIDNEEYEVDYKYASKRVLLRYTPDLERAYIVDEGKLYPIHKLDKYHNNDSHRRTERFMMSKEDHDGLHI